MQGGERYLLHFKPLQKLSVSPRLTLCLLSAGYRRRRVIKHGSRQRRAGGSRLNNTVFAPPMGRTDIMKPGAVSVWHRLMILMPERRTRCKTKDRAETVFAALLMPLLQAASSAPALIAALLGGGSPSVCLSCLP